MAYTTIPRPLRDDDDERKPFPHIITGNGLLRCDQCRSMVEHVRDIGGHSLCDECFLAQFPPDNALQTLHCDLCQADITHACETDDGLLLCEECAATYQPEAGPETTIITRNADTLPASLHEHKQAILQLEQCIKTHILEIGKRLIQVNDDLAHTKGGSFEAWVERELGWSKKTAYNYINVARRFGSRPAIAQLPIPQSALYMLANKSTPETVCEAVFEVAERGQQLTFRQIEQMIQAALRQPPPRRPMETARLTEASSTAESPKTSCLFCKRRDLPVHVPEPGSRIGICRACAQKALAQLPAD